MNLKSKKHHGLLFFSMLVFAAGIFISLPASADAQTAEELQQRVMQLESELAATRAELEKATQAAAPKEEKKSDKIQIGPLKVGGAIRANWVLGDYNDSSSGPSRGGHGGNVVLDTFRINLDYAQGQWVAKAEYRFYDGYNFLHTGWVGYNFQDESQIQVGVNRVPFGPTAYGISQSWFFDQHYYVGLADDMDLGVKYKKSMGNWDVDVAYYLTDEGDWRGGKNSTDSARYSYDVVDERGDGYEENHQLNLRAIYHISEIAVPTDIGTSLQYSMLESNGPQDDGDHYAASVHMVNSWNNWKLASQLTYYKYDIDPYTNNTGATTDKLIDMGAFDYAYPVAAEAWIPGVSLSYYLETPGIPFLDYIIPYVEYSSIVKEESSFNDSELMTVGIAWASGGWYCYAEYARSNGNYFVGNDSFTEFGANPNDDWQDRFNINLGYYF